MRDRPQTFPAAAVCELLTLARPGPPGRGFHHSRGRARDKATSAFQPWVRTRSTAWNPSLFWPDDEPSNSRQTKHRSVLRPEQLRRGFEHPFAVLEQPLTVAADKVE